MCSLVARQARNVLDGTKTTTPPPTAAHKAASGSRKAMASFSLKQPASGDGTVMVPKLDSSESKEGMPPPPPRAPNGTEPLPIPKKENGADDAQMNPCESPPSSYQLARPGLAALAAAASPSIEEEQAADPSLLGKSLDSSKISFLIDASMREPGTSAAVAPTSSPSRRPRSESVDVAAVSRSSHQQGAGAEEYDPTLETELTREVDQTSVDEPKVHTRRRSASLGQSPSQCDTIAEETVTSEEPMFLMEEESDS